MKPKMQFTSRKQRLSRLPLPYFFGNRQVKDRLFCYIFEHDKKALLQLYNALNGTDYQDEHALLIITLDNVVYMSMHNDVAFLLTGTLNLYEHQSTLCPNLPLRFLLYLAAEYESLVERTQANLYGQTLINLPAPQCIVFYNGDRQMKEDYYLHLADAFTGEPEITRIPCLELTVRVLNINHGHNKEIMENCRRLEEYSLFVAKFKEYRQYCDSMSQAIDNAVLYCIEHEIMADILLPFRAEVKKMLLTEYNERKVMKMFRKEAREEGYKEGKQSGLQEGRQEGLQEGIRKGQARLVNAMLQNNVSAEKISELTGLSLQQIAQFRQNTP